MFRGIRASTLAKVRANVAATLTDSCTIQRETDAVGDMGEALHEYGDVETVACRLIQAGQRTTGTADSVGGREELTDRYRLILPVGTAISAGYRARMADGTTYEVVDVDADLTDAAFVGAVVMRSRGRDDG